MSAPPPPVPVPDAAGWVLVAGVSASLHLAAASAMVLALAGQPQAPVSGTAGVVIRNLPPVTGTTADLGRAQRLLQGLHDTPCHLVIRLQGGVPGLAALGRDPGLLAEAGKRLAETFVPEARPTLATHPVASGQCPVLDFARVAGDDPMRGIELDLWRPTVSDERPLAGTLLHDHPGSLHLLLADAAGQVHDLTGFLRPGPDGSDFLVPVSGSADGGRGLLVAIATPFPLESLRAHSGPRPTGRVFESLAAELAQLGMVPDLALAAFALE